MLNVSQILVKGIGLAVLGVGLAGCGQRGPLYLPTDPAAANRSTLPQTLLPIPTREESTTVIPSPQPGEKPASNATNNNNNNNSNNSSTNPTGAAR